MDIMDRKACAALLDMSASKLRKMEGRGVGPKFTMRHQGGTGGQAVYRLSDVQAWAAENGYDLSADRADEV
ncbi:MAG: hypothetical protein ACYDD1_07080 [Caulobacteraceae bacterium]